MNGRFVVEETGIAGVRLVRRRTFGDDRGYLSRLFCAEELAAAGWHAPIAQINHTFTAEAGTVRGLHFQHPPNAEMKLVTCLKGEIFDVALDLREGSPTFGCVRSAVLSADNLSALLIPEGCAHGFQTLSADVELLYLHSAAYDPGSEGGLSPLDPRLAIDWPQPVTKISDRDAGHPNLTPDFRGLRCAVPSL